MAKIIHIFECQKHISLAHQVLCTLNVIIVIVFSFLYLLSYICIKKYQVSTHPLRIEVCSSIVAIEADVTDGVDVEPVQPALKSSHLPVDPHVPSPLQGNLYQSHEICLTCES